MNTKDLFFAIFVINFSAILYVLGLSLVSLAILVTAIICPYIFNKYDK